MSSIGLDLADHLSAATPPTGYDWSNLQGSSIRVYNNYASDDAVCDPEVQRAIFSEIAGDAEVMSNVWQDKTNADIHTRVSDDSYELLKGLIGFSTAWVDPADEAFVCVV